MDRQDHTAAKMEEEVIGDNEFFAVMRFFYLVRLAQQGLFHLIASAYPEIEPNAITLLADKLVAGSMGKVSSTSRHDLDVSRRYARKIAKHLYEQVDEPVADGFKTTFKDIMQVADRLGMQGLYEQHKMNQQGEHGQTSETRQASVAASATATVGIPPIWVVMPYSSMLDQPTMTVPHINPNLPIPGFLISSNTNTQRASESDKRNKKKRTKKIPRKARNDGSTTQETDAKADKIKDDEEEQPPQENTTLDENVAEDADNREIGTSEQTIMNQGPDNTVKNDVSGQNNNNTQDLMHRQNDSEEDDEEDRFADADSSDDDSDIEEKQQAPQSDTVTVNKTSPTAIIAEKEPDVPSQWHLFAASCRIDKDNVKSSRSSASKINRKQK